MLARPIPLITQVIIGLHVCNILHVWHIANGLSTTTTTAATNSSVSPLDVTGKECSEKHTKRTVTSEYYNSVCYSEQRTCDQQHPWNCTTRKVSGFCSQLRYREVYSTSVIEVCCHGYVLDYTQDVCIRVCPTGKYGDDCLETCTCLPTQNCDPYTGTCACKPGYTGSGCVNVCQPKTFGVNCAKMCNCEWGNTISCDGASGACWCRGGWVDTSCQTACPQGYFGFDCNHRCNCSTNQTCDSESGDCTCATGYTGIYCTERIVPSAKTEDGVPDYLLIVIQVILAVIVLVIILAIIIHCVRKRNLRESHDCTDGSVSGNTNTILADYYSNLSVKELQKKRKPDGRHSPRRSHAPNGSLYTEVDKPGGTKHISPYQHSSVVFIKRTSIKDNGTDNVVDNNDKKQKLGSGEPPHVKACVNEGATTEDTYDKLGKDRHVNKATKPGTDQYDHMKLNQSKTGNVEDAYDELEQRSRSSEKKLDNIDDTYDHTQDLS